MATRPGERLQIPSTGDVLHQKPPIGDCRTSPPWAPDYIRAQAPALGVAFADGTYIIRGRGGHIVGSTQSLEEVGRLIQLESERGYGAVELRLQGHTCPAGIHGIGRTPERRAVLRQSRTKVGLPILTLEDLGLAEEVTLDDLGLV